jgi:hypothetical protein
MAMVVCGISAFILQRLDGSSSPSVRVGSRRRGGGDGGGGGDGRWTRGDFEGADGVGADHHDQNGVWD